MHFSACLWIWFNLVLLLNNFVSNNIKLEINQESEVSWFNYLELNNRPLGQVYVFGLLFFMNLATTTGYPELIVYNNSERAIAIFFIWIGDALFALTFGMLAINIKTLPEKYQNVFDRIR